MDGFALARQRAARRRRPPQLRIVGTGLAGQTFAGEVPAGGCVRITDRRRHAERSGHRGAAGVHPDRGRRRCIVPPASAAQRRQPAPGRRRPGARRRRAGGRPRAASGRPGPAGLARPGRGAGAAAPARGLLLHRRRAALDRRAAATPAASTTATATPCGACCSAWACEVLDLGVVRDDPAALREAFSTGGGLCRRGHHLGRRQRRRGRPHQAASWPSWATCCSGASRCGRGARWRSGASAMPAGQAILFGLPGNPVAVMVTFYAFVRDALLRMAGAAPTAAAAAARGQRQRRSARSPAAPSTSAASSADRPTAPGRWRSPAPRAAASCAA